MRRTRLSVVATSILLALAACSVDTGAPNGATGEAAQDSAGPDSAPVSPGQDDKSTFAVDIDTASYELARQNITDGHLPDPQTVRPEEFVNSFKQDYAPPPGNGMSATMDGAAMPSWYSDNDEPTHLLRVGLATRPETDTERRDARLTFVIDTSGSMTEYLELVKESLHILIDELRPSDSVGIVTYSDEAGVVSQMTPVEDKTVLHSAIDELAIGGSTNLEGGMISGYQVARDGYDPQATNRVILLSDGLANVGATEDDTILEQVKENAGDGIALLCVGVGSQYGDELMEQLADNGDGFAVYFSTATQARKLFVEQLPATLAVRAKDAKVQVTFATDTVESYRLIGFDNRAVADEDFTDDSVDGGEVGPGHQVTALYAVVLKSGAAGEVASTQVRWLAPDSAEASTASARITAQEMVGDFTSASQRMGVDLVAAAFAERLRGDERLGELSLASLAEQATALALTTEDPKVVELAELITAASELD